MRQILSFLCSQELRRTNIYHMIIEAEKGVSQGV
jgi:hypothetical protein